MMSFPHRRELEDGDSENWLVSYADLITLLFVFFCLMLSISTVSRSRLDMLKQTFNKKTHSALQDVKAQLDQSIKEQNLDGKVKTELTDQGLSVQFDENVLFSSGEAAVSLNGVKTLKEFAIILAKIEKSFQLAIEGHTDHIPIHNKQFSSNWALSAMRAVEVLHFLKENGVNERQMMVHGFSDTRPLATQEDFSKNRRVNLLIF